jgi:2-polyprenyl-3-methyl-5-hydroxy-6-metoxy-1,4-benzoquinol methylase
MPDRKHFIENYFDNTNIYLNDNLVIDLRAKLILNNLPKIENKEIIDIGCGNGEISLPYLENNKITFLDLSDNMLELVRKRIPQESFGNAELIKLDFENYPYNKKFDFLFLLGVLAHVQSVSNTISKIADLTKNDGIIILQYTNSKNIISLVLRIIGYLKMLMGQKYGYKINFFSTGELTKILNFHELKWYNKISYWPALPGFKLIPKGVRKYFYYKVLNGKILHSLGGENILFIKHKETIPVK